VTMQFNLSVLNYCRITNRSEGGTQLYLSIFPHHDFSLAAAARNKEVTNFTASSMVYRVDYQ
jgi:hypothetical protein